MKKIILITILVIIAFIVISFIATGGFSGCSYSWGKSECSSGQFCRLGDNPDAGGVCLPNFFPFTLFAPASTI